MDKIEQHLSCLSCSKVYADSLMLVCGHSICNDVSHTSHSSPLKPYIVFIFAFRSQEQRLNRFLRRMQDRYQEQTLDKISSYKGYKSELPIVTTDGRYYYK
jgi:hypothetical protein